MGCVCIVRENASGNTCTIMKCFFALTAILLLVTLAGSQLITPTMMCEMKCIKEKTGESSAPWDSPAAQDCKKECIKKLLDMIPPELRGDIKAIYGEEEANHK